MSSTDAFEPNTGAPAPVARTRPFFWSVRRELWESRSIVVGPLIAAAIALAGFFVSLVHPFKIRGSNGRAPPQLGAELPYDMAMFFIVCAGILVAVFYCLGALHNERRDRSILFWKSLPVSDRTAVLAKFAVPMAVIPAVTIAVVLVTEALMLAMSAISLLAAGKDVAAHWAQLSLVTNIPLFVYSVAAVALWHAPIWAWLLAVSAWARRAPFLWAVGPWLGAFAAEKIAFNTDYVWQLVAHRLGGAVHAALKVVPGPRQPTVLPEADVGKFITDPGLWAGLFVAALLIAATIWLRRRREPI